MEGIKKSFVFCNFLNKIVFFYEGKLYRDPFRDTAGAKSTVM
jgi:hypothetical protein